MDLPCGHNNYRIIDSRKLTEYTRRRVECRVCGQRHRTVEFVMPAKPGEKTAKHFSRLIFKRMMEG